jgi:hypothetical protein
VRGNQSETSASIRMRLAALARDRYGFDPPGAADYMLLIIHGAQPSEQPVQRPTKFELVVNLKTARSLGKPIPPSILAPLIEEALNLADHGGRARDQSFNITLERDYADPLAPIELVPQDITRVCLNLFSNGFYAAIKRQEQGSGPKFKPTL